MEEKELELLVNETLDRVKNNKEVSSDELQYTLERCKWFINYCKFEFGENVTG